MTLRHGIARAIATAALAGSLAGCSLFAPSPPVSPVVEACRSQADDAPAVRAIMNKFEGNQHYQREHMDELNAAKQDATTECLRSRGVVRRGGVERQKPLQ